MKVYIITHIASGEYTADKFEREMQRNVDTMIRALVTEAMSRTPASAAARSRSTISRSAATARRCWTTCRSGSRAAGCTSIVGPNGAGKSTLLSAVLGLIPFDGRIVLNWRGSRRDRLRAAELRRRSDAAGDGRRFSRAHAPAAAGLPRHQRRARAETRRALLERVGLPGLERRPLAVLSGGELRRVLLAHALDPEPELLHPRRADQRPRRGVGAVARGDAHGDEARRAARRS